MPKRRRIAIVTRWNATCGVSLHGELVGRTLVEMGYEVTVFAPTVESAAGDWHHKVIKPDEDYVVRCFDETDEWSGRWDCDLQGYDLIIVEGYRRLPAKQLNEALREAARSGAFTLMVPHEGYWEQTAPLLDFEYDAVAVFDERWLREVLYSARRRLQGRTHVVPYPCVEPLDVEPAEPPFEVSGALLVTFGRQPIEEYQDFVEALDSLSSRYDFTWWVIRSDDAQLPFEGRPYVRVERRRLSLEEVHATLKAAHVHLLPKGWTGKVAVSSTVYQTLSTGTPIVTPDTRFTETLPVDEEGFGVVVRFWGPGDLAAKLSLLLDSGAVWDKVSRSAMRYAEENSRWVVTRELLRIARLR